MSAFEGQETGQTPTEEELRAAYEEEIKRIRVEHVLLDHTVTLINLGMRRTGLAPGTESERDPGQVRLAIEAVRAMLPLVEGVAGEQAGALRDALSQLQLAFVRVGGEAQGAGSPEPGRASPTGADAPTPGPEPAAGPEPTAPRSGAPASAPGSTPPGAGNREEEGPGPAQRSGRLWIPGQ